MALSSGNCHGINIWGLSDKYSWIPSYSGGRNGAATLFDKDYNPKPAVAAISEVLQK
jgi:endo-1,4-beta-xylanase